jgi:polyhydroxyalkanoate synthesis regulator phasin
MATADALRGYLSLAGGLTEVTRQRAVAQAKALLADGALDPLVDAGRQAGSQVQALADEIVATGRANRDLIVGIARTEAERVVGTFGAAGRDEVAALQAQVERLTRRVADLEEHAGPGRGGTATKKAATKKTAPKKTAPSDAAAPAGARVGGDDDH